MGKRGATPTVDLGNAQERSFMLGKIIPDISLGRNVIPASARDGVQGSAREGSKPLTARVNSSDAKKEHEIKPA